MDRLKQAGIDKLIIYAVNDGAVMKAWKKDQKVDHPDIDFFADPMTEFTSSLSPELNLNAEGPYQKGLIGRCKRYVMLVENSVVKDLRIAESEEDPAGDDFPEVTMPEGALDMLRMHGQVHDEL